MSEKETLEPDEKSTKKKLSTKEKLVELQEKYDQMEAEYKRMKEELFLAKEAAKESMEMVKNFKLDVDRIRERSEALNAELHEKITMEVVAKLIPTIDNFENAISKMVEGSSEKKGCEMIYRSLLRQLESLEIRRIECTAGVFDPEKMEAISIVSTDNPELVGTVAQVITMGYYYRPSDKVIRYTQVAVYK